MNLKDWCRAAGPLGPPLFLFDQLIIFLSTPSQKLECAKPYHESIDGIALAVGIAFVAIVVFLVVILAFK